MKWLLNLENTLKILLKIQTTNDSHPILYYTQTAAAARQLREGSDANHKEGSCKKFYRQKQTS